MPFDPAARSAIFIDGANLSAAARNLGFEIDYCRLLDFFRCNGRLIRALYYIAVSEDDEYSSSRPLIDWLGYNGFLTVTKRAKEFIDANGRRKITGNLNIEIAVDAMSLANRVDHVIIFSGDGNLRYLIDALQQLGKRVSVVSSLQQQSQMAADALRRQADSFIDLLDLKKQIGRQHRVRAGRDLH